jgi:hypothetical protein
LLMSSFFVTAQVTVGSPFSATSIQLALLRQIDSGGATGLVPQGRI